MLAPMTATDGTYDPKGDPRVPQHITAELDMTGRPTFADPDEAADDREAQRTGGTFTGKYLVPADRAAIDQAETARVEAMLQVCKLLPAEFTESRGALSTMLARWVVAIQHDMIEDLRLRVEVVGVTLAGLAGEWHVLPIDARTVILAGLLPAGRELSWASYVHQVAVRGPNREYFQTELLRIILGTEIDL